VIVAAPPSPTMADRLSRILPTLFLLALVVAWEAAVRIFAIPAFLLPGPVAIVEKMAQNIERLLLVHAWATLREVLIGFGMAALGGISLAVLIAHSKVLSRTLYPVLVITQVVPTIAVAPMLTIWVGPTDASRLIVVFLIAFFPIVVNTTAGLLRVDEELIDLIRGLNASRWKIFTKIRMPNALPYLFTGMRISITLSVIGAVVDEFVVSERGLGYLIFSAASNLDILLVFSGVVLLAAMGIILFQLIRLIQRIALPWADDAKEGEA
jgi:NitT/TauT family transport system permease protein